MPFFVAVSDAFGSSTRREDGIPCGAVRHGVVAGFTGWSEKQRRRYGRVVSWDARSGEQLSEIDVPLQWPTKLAVHLDGRVAIGAKSDHVVAVWGARRQGGRHVGGPRWPLRLRHRLRSRRGARDPRHEPMDLALPGRKPGAALRLHIRARRGFPRARFGEHTHIWAPPGYVADPTYDDSRLTATDLENLETILSAEVRVGSPRVASARRSWADVAWGIVPGGPPSSPGDSDWSFYYAQCAY